MDHTSARTFSAVSAGVLTAGLLSTLVTGTLGDDGRAAAVVPDAVPTKIIPAKIIPAKISFPGEQPSRSPRGRHFDHPRINPWFPLRPGLTTVLRGTDEGDHLIEYVRVTHRHKMITGVRTTVVRDVLRHTDGTLAELTADWYASDNSGAVWYFGERTATYDRHGRLESREGSWQAGVHGARAGLIMPAHPHATDAYRQEYLKGHAEDQAWIVSRHADANAPVKHVTNALQTFEWSRLESGVISEKLYARGIGIIKERDLVGGTESFAVVAIHH
jgi:hypothetical protein